MLGTDKDQGEEAWDAMLGEWQAYVDGRVGGKQDKSSDEVEEDDGYKHHNHDNHDNREPDL